MDHIIDQLFKLAVECIASGNRPMPAIVAEDGEIIYRSHDLVMASQDPTIHGEMSAIKGACSKLGLPHLRGYDLYSFGEPCIMCCGAIHWAKLDCVTNCLSQETLKSISGGGSKPGIRDYLPLGNRTIQIVGPIREKDAFEVARQYNW